MADYWRTLKGLLVRVADIAHHFTWTTLNAITKEYAAVIEVEEPEAQKILEWVTMEDDKVCDYCDANAGEYDPNDPFLPDMNPHNLCRCFWRVTVKV